MYENELSKGDAINTHFTKLLYTNTVIPYVYRRHSHILEAV